MAKRHADRAVALVGTPFRPQGRGEGGVDCVGLALIVFGMPAHLVRDDYRLRGMHGDEAEQLVRQFFRRVTPNKSKAGDLVLLAPRADQIHFAIRTVRGFVHADASLRKVVETPGEPGWPVIGFYRRRASKAGI